MTRLFPLAQILAKSSKPQSSKLEIVVGLNLPGVAGPVQVHLRLKAKKPMAKRGTQVWYSC
jgi:hypothetical protein